jgi:leucyl aminopeptidase
MRGSLESQNQRPSGQRGQKPKLGRLQMDVRFQAAAGAGIVVAFAGKGDDGAVLSPPGLALDRACKKRISQSMAAARFRGESGTHLVITAPGAGYDLAVICGVADLAKVSGEDLEKAGAVAVRATLTSGIETASVLLSGWRKVANGANAARIGFGACLAAYRFDGYRTTLKAHQKPSLTQFIIDQTDGSDHWAAHQAVVDGVWLARDLVNEPSNVLHPEAYAARIEGLASLGLTIKVLGEAEMTDLGMKANWPSWNGMVVVKKPRSPWLARACALIPAASPSSLQAAWKT